MRRMILLVLSVFFAQFATAQEAGEAEMVDQHIQAAAFVFTGARAVRPPVNEYVDQTLRADAFVFTGSRATP